MGSTVKSLNKIIQAQGPCLCVLPSAARRSCRADTCQVLGRRVARSQPCAPAKRRPGPDSQWRAGLADHPEIALELLLLLSFFPCHDLLTLFVGSLTSLTCGEPRDSDQRGRPLLPRMPRGRVSRASASVSFTT